MTASTENATEAHTPLFDVVISLPPRAQLEEIERKALDVAGLAPERVERMMQALRSAPQAKVGAGVTRERADFAHAQFSKAGLLVEITPLLTIQAPVAGSYDGTYLCRGCDKRVVLPESRQCPSCGIFVDKITDEFLLKRKLMEQERGKIEFQKARSAQESDKRSREMQEAAMRARIREELEKEYGIGGKKGLFSGLPASVRFAGLAALIAVAFVGGRGLSPDGFPWSKSASAKENSPKVMTADSLEKASQGAAAGDGEVTATGDPDLDDPLIQAAGGQRIGAKGLTIEQAVAAAQTLAKSVGNTTAERALAGGQVGGQTGGPDGSAGNSAQAKAENAGIGAAAGQAPGAAPAADVPKQTKQVLAAEFARILAELGQTARARHVLQAATVSLDPAADPQAAAALRQAELKAQAWAIQRRQAGPIRQATEDLKAKILALASPAERTQLLGSVAVILSRGDQLQTELPRTFLSLAAESLKSVTGPGQPNTALGDLAVSMAEVFANEAIARAKAGMWTKAQASASQVEALIKQAPDAWSQLRLYAIDHQIKQQMGHSDKARQSLDAALAQVGKTSSLLEQATWLRSAAQLADAAAQEQTQAMTTSLQAQLESKPGLEKAQALTQLALLYASGGLPAKAEQFRRLAQSTAGLSPAESTAINTDLIVRSDLAMAKVLQGLGRYAEAESLLQRVSGYLF